MPLILSQADITVKCDCIQLRSHCAIVGSGYSVQNQNTVQGPNAVWETLEKYSQASSLVTDLLVIS